LVSIPLSQATSGVTAATKESLSTLMLSVAYNKRGSCKLFRTPGMRCMFSKPDLDWRILLTIIALTSTIPMMAYPTSCKRQEMISTMTLSVVALKALPQRMLLGKTSTFSARQPKCQMP